MPEGRGNSSGSDFTAAVDQHMLLALIAPRFLYLTGSLENPWANPESELESARLASEAYALYGLWGLQLPKEPKEGKLYKEGRIGCYIHKGVHEMTEMEWELLLDFADEKFHFARSQKIKRF